MKLVIAFVLLSNFISAQAWTQLTDFPNTERDDGVVAVINTKAYFGTGLLAGFTLGKDFYALDLTNNSWSAIAPMPTGSERQYACAFTYSNSFYVFSGSGYSNVTFTDLQRYDVATNTWTVLAGKPGNGLIGAGCLEYGNKIIIVGGKFQNDVVSDEVWEYNITTNKWSQKNNSPFGGRWRASATVLNGVGYLLFGKDNNQSFRKELYSYNHTTDVWTKVMDFVQPNGRAYSTLKGTSTKLILFGGYDTLNTYYNDVWYFNDVTTAWTQGPTLPSGGRKGGMGCVAYDHFYYTCGINVSDTRLKETWVIDVPLGIKENANQIDFLVYPNPCADKLFINTNATNYTIEICDLTSKVIFSQRINFVNEIELPALEKGIYFLKLIAESKIIFAKKIIKE